MIGEKKITIKKIKIKSNQILNDEIKKKKKFKIKYIAIKILKIKFDIINKLKYIFYFYVFSRKFYFVQNKRKILS